MADETPDISEDWKDVRPKAKKPAKERPPRKRPQNVIKWFDDSLKRFIGILYRGRPQVYWVVGVTVQGELTDGSTHRLDLNARGESLLQAMRDLRTQFRGKVTERLGIFSGEAQAAQRKSKEIMAKVTELRRILGLETDGTSVEAAIENYENVDYDDEMLPF